MKTLPSPPAHRPARFVKTAAALALLGLLSACQQNPVQVSAKSVNPRLGGLNPGETYTVVNCPNISGTTCTINVVAAAPTGGGGVCHVTLDSAVSLPKTLTTLVWQLQGSDGTYDYRFRNAITPEPAGYGVRLIDNLMYPEPPPSSPPSPMRPIWVQQVQKPDIVQFERVQKEWPPRISAYNVYLEYQLKGTKTWTPCNTYDPIVISRD